MWGVCNFLFLLLCLDPKELNIKHIFPFVTQSVGSFIDFIITFFVIHLNSDFHFAFNANGIVCGGCITGFMSLLTKM